MSQSVTTKTEQGLYVHPEALTAHLPALDYRDGALYMEQVSIDEVAKHYGTPCYVYSKQAVLDVYQAYTTSFASLKHQICYAVKANSNLAVLGILAQAGAGFDIVSRGELMRVLAAGGKAERVVFSGVGKTYSEIEYALNQGIGCFNVESISELALINEVAKALDKTAPISLRVNPDVDAKTHPYISTGLTGNKFGIPHTEALAAYQQAAALAGLRVVGIDCHIGSQITEIAPYLDAAARLLDVVELVEAAGIALPHIDFGGGLGIAYNGETPPAADALCQQILALLDARGMGQRQLVFEPGRSLVGNAGVCVTEVLYLKHGQSKNFCIVDAAMNDLPRPAMYQAYHQIVPLEQSAAAQASTYDVVGPVCESGDWLGNERRLSVQQGDLLAVMSAGAYCMSMASNYNSRARAAEVLVADGQVHLIGEREPFAALVQRERML